MTTTASSMTAHGPALRCLLLGVTMLAREWRRAALSVAAVGAAVALVLLFQGFRAGLYTQARAFTEALPGDLVATQRGVSSVLGARSILPQSARAEIEAISGVRAAHPLAGVPVIFSRGEDVAPVYVVAYDTAGGPDRLAAGRPIAAPGEIVVDAALAHRFGLVPGTEVEFLAYPFTVAGVSSAGSNALNPYVFVRLVDLVDLYVSGDLPADLDVTAMLSFLLVELEPGADATATRAAIERDVAAVDVFTPAELAANDVRVVSGFMGTALDLLVGVAYMAGILVIGLTLYASASGRLREFAVMKAIGARRSWLRVQLLGEAMVVSSVALGVGMVLAEGAARTVAALAPQYLVQPLEPAVLASVLVTVPLVAGAGALLPMRRVERVDPAMVFGR